MNDEDLGSSTNAAPGTTLPIQPGNTYVHTKKTHERPNLSLIPSTEDVKEVVKHPIGSAPADEEDQVQRRQMRWWFCWVGLTLSILLFLAAIVCTTIAFCSTKNLASLSIFTTAAPPAYFINRFMSWIAEYVFPMDERTFQLKKHQAEAKA